MATVQLTDVIVPEVFDNYVTQNTAKLSVVQSSGLLVEDAELSNKLAGGGLVFQAPAWADLADTDGAASSDDPNDLLTLQKVGTFKPTAHRMTQNEGWAAMMFASELAGSDAMDRIGDRAAAYWARQRDHWTVQTLLGVLGANQANNAGDMFHDAGAATMSGGVILDAASDKLGDAADKLSIMVVHSRVHKRMQKQGLLTNAFTREDSISMRPIEMYANKYRVVISDSMPNGNPKTAGNPGGGASLNGVALTANQFVSVLSEGGVIRYGSTSHKKPVYMNEEGLAGGGSGEEQLVMRKIFSFHPVGHQTATGGYAKETPIAAELAAATTFTRVLPEQKQMGLVGLLTTEN